jgi:hypothetical protein
MRQPQSEIPAYRQASAFETANFFMDDTASAYLSLIHNSRPDNLALLI